MKGSACPALVSIIVFRRVVELVVFESRLEKRFARQGVKNNMGLISTDAIHGNTKCFECEVLQYTGKHLDAH